MRSWRKNSTIAQSNGELICVCSSKARETSHWHPMVSVSNALARLQSIYHPQGALLPCFSRKLDRCQGPLAGCTMMGGGGVCVVKVPCGMSTASFQNIQLLACNIAFSLPHQPIDQQVLVSACGTLMGMSKLTP